MGHFLDAGIAEHYPDMVLVRGGYWSISISGNWRVTFRIEDGDAYDVDLTDYH